MGSVADAGKLLCGNKESFSVSAYGTFHHKDAVIFRVINEINDAVTGQRMSHGKIRGHDLPFV